VGRKGTRSTTPHRARSEKLVIVDPSAKASGSGVATDDPRTRRPAAIDLAIVIAFAATLNVIAFRMTERYAGPVTALCTVALMTVLMRRRGTRWRDLGLRRPGRPWWLFAQVPAVLFGAVAVSAGAAAIVGQYLPAPDTSPRFGNLAGNLPGMLWWIGLGWLVGGFAEEMMFRGFLLNRFEALLPRGAWGTATAVFLQAFLFGAVHVYYRGLYGLVVLGSFGAVMGVFYLVFRRNLWPLVLGHGLRNMLGFLAQYFDAPKG
jgi:membrane protease YdiL (CAAX protease family)